ncbi:ABC transporter substrate-binding protein [Dactylosporangium matsuzakiense]|uniref:Sugar ABC transporter substrate-binding protein n=1 Tax=Dactylosporangium matsuzakiense TaxID=53360 RepID=A0A9W6NQL3_9ACTN|nr:extracellular solute-binding protein [Dactylosporangium matsuzakiense]UWZ48516.1 extracellular solute-binding protein [Dactylosporangium matsuzakiense]GLL06340.1 sugar ABC transporter substrate-binding protein [Dactylosporangium matsuzakiense]
MTYRRLVTAMVGVATVLAATTACGSSGGGGGSADAVDFGAKATGTLSAWGFNNADDVGKARIGYAAQQLGDVKIEMDQTNFDAQKFTTRLASGSVPDVVQMDRELVITYAAQNLVMPLDKCLSANTVDAKQRWYPNVVADVTYKNQIWAVPQFYQPAAILLNRTLMEAAGVQDADIDTSNPDRLIAAIAKMYKANGDVPATLGFNPQATGQIPLWLVAMGGKVADADGKPTLTDPANAAAIELLKKIVDAQGGYAKYKSFTDSFDVFGDKNQFVGNQVAAEVDAQWYPNVLSPYKDKVKLGAVPFKGKDGQPVTQAGGTAFVIPAKAKNPAAACKWALALTDDGSWSAAAEARAATVKAKNSVNTGLFTGSPAADKAIRDKYITSSGSAGFDQVISTYYDIVGTGKSAGASPAGQQIKQEMLNAVTAALLGTKTVQKALEDAQAASMGAYKNIVG